MVEILQPDVPVDETVEPYRAHFALVVALPDDLVRIKWPSDPRQIPEPPTNWMLVALLEVDDAESPLIQHHDNGFGYDTLTAHEEQRVLVSAYGPKARTYAKQLKRGLQLPQNMEPLTLQAISFVDCGIIRSVPEKQNQQWVNRADMLITFRRRVSSRYGVRTIETADIRLFDDTHVDRLIEVTHDS